MNFNQVCLVLEELSKHSNLNKNSKRMKFKSILTKLQWENNLECLDLILRILLPSEDKKRKYSVGFKILKDHLIDQFAFKKTLHGQRLNNWNSDMSMNLRGQGDFGTVVQLVLESIGRSETNINISKLCDLFNELALTSEWSTIEQNVQPRSRKLILNDIFNGKGPIAAKWISRIILKEMGYDPFDIMHAMHPILPYLYKMQGCLEKTAIIMSQIVKDGHTCSKFYSKSGFNLDLFNYCKREYCVPRVGVFITTMQSSQCRSIAHAYQHMSELSKKLPIQFTAELKYDGERMQIHYDEAGNPPLQIYSKSGRNSTIDRIDAHDVIIKSLRLEPANEHESTPMKQRITKLILDAELLVYDEIEDKIEIFGGITEFRRGTNKRKKLSRHLYVVFFDCLAINDLNLLVMPWNQRRNYLETVVQPIEKYSKLSEITHYTVENENWDFFTLKSLREYFASCINEGEEGLMLKPYDSEYVPGSRKHWLKMKPDYMQGLAPVNEYCILGGSWDPSETFLGMKRDECNYLLNKFFVGLLLNKEEFLELGSKPKFRILFSFSAGFSRDSLMDFSAMLVKERVRNRFDLNYEISNSKTPDIEYFFDTPQVVSLKSSSYEKKGFSWVPRHPRFERLRTIDIPFWEAITYQELQKLGAEGIKCSGISKNTKLIQVLENLDEAYLRKKGFLKPVDEASLKIIIDGCWIFHQKVNKIRFKDSVLNSVYAFLAGTGWNCNEDCKSHRPGIVFASTDDINNEKSLGFFEPLMETVRCDSAKPIYVVDYEMWKLNEDELLDRSQIIAELDPNGGV